MEVEDCSRELGAIVGRNVDMEVLDKIAAVKVHDTDRFERIPVNTVLIESVKQIQ